MPPSAPSSRSWPSDFSGERLWPEKEDATKDTNNAKRNLVGVLLAAFAAVICAAIDELLKEEKL